MAGQTISFKVQVLTTQAEVAIKNLKKYLEILEKQIAAVTDKKSPQWKKLNSEINSVTKSINTLNSSMGKLNATTKTTGNMFMNITRYFTSFLLVQQVTNAIRYATKSFVDFQRTIVMNRALLQGSTKDLKEMETQALDLGKSTIFTANQVAELQTQLIKLGVTSTKALKPMTEAVVNLAAAAGEDLATAGNVVYSVLNQYQIDAKHSIELTDIMSKALVESAMDLTSLSVSLKYVGSTANMLNLTMAQTTAMLELLSSVGIKGSSAGTSLNAMLIEMTKSSSKLTRETGIQVKSFEDILKTFQSLESRGISASKMFDMLNIRAGRAAATLSQPKLLKQLELFTASLGDPKMIKKLTDEYEKLSDLKVSKGLNEVDTTRLEELTKALYEVDEAGKVLVQDGEKVTKTVSGYAADTASKAINSVAGDLKLLTSNLTNLGIEILNTKNGPIRDFVQGLNDIVNNLRYTITGIGEHSDAIQRWMKVIYEVAKAWLFFYASSKLTQFSSWVSSGIGVLRNFGTQLKILGGEIKAAAVHIKTYGATIKTFSASSKLALQSLSLSWKAFWAGIKASNPIGWVLLLVDALVIAGKALVKLFTDAEKAKKRAENKQTKEDVNGMLSDYEKVIKKNKQMYDDLLTQTDKYSDRQIEAIKQSLDQELELREDLDAKLRQMGIDKLKDDKDFQEWIKLLNKQKNDTLTEQEQKFVDDNRARNEQKIKDATKTAEKELKITENLVNSQIDEAKRMVFTVNKIIKSRSKIEPFLPDGTPNPENIDKSTGDLGNTPSWTNPNKLKSGIKLPSGMNSNPNKSWEDDQMRLLDTEAKIAEARREAQKDNDKLVEDAYNKRKMYYEYEQKLLNQYLADEQKRLEETQRITVKLEELQTDRTKNLETASDERKRILERDIKIQNDVLDNDLEQVKEYSKQRKKLLEADTLSDQSKTTMPMSQLDFKSIRGQIDILNAELQIESEDLKNAALDDFNKATEKIGIEYAKRKNEIEREFLDYEKTAQNFINTLKSKKEISYNALTDKELEFLGKQKSDQKLSNDDRLKLEEDYTTKLAAETEKRNTTIKALDLEIVDEKDKSHESYKQTVVAGEKYITDKTELYRREALSYIQEVQDEYKRTQMDLYNQTAKGPNIKGKLGESALNMKSDLKGVDNKLAEDLKKLGSAKVKELGLEEMYQQQKLDIIKKYEKEALDIKLQGITEYAGAVQESIAVLSEIFSTQKQMEQDIIDSKYEKDIKDAEDTKNNLIKLYGLKNKKEEQMTANQKRKLEKINLQAEEKRQKAEEEKEKKSLDLKKKFANKEFAISIANILISTGLGVMKAIAQFGPVVGGIMGGLVVALGAVQIAAAKKQRDSVQNLGEGGDVIGKPHSQGGVPVELEGGEVVIKKKSAAIPWVRQMALQLNSAADQRVSTGRIMANGGLVKTSTVTNYTGISEDMVKTIVDETTRGVVNTLRVTNNALETNAQINNNKRVINMTTR